MNNQKNRNDGNGRRPLYLYYVLAFLVIMLLNQYVFPTLWKPQVDDIPYSTFLQMVDEGKFSKVEISDSKASKPSLSRNPSLVSSVNVTFLRKVAR